MYIQEAKCQPDRLIGWHFYLTPSPIGWHFYLTPVPDSNTVTSYQADK
ncbi:hypothetical protein LTSEGIV_1329 [Salmonella enterica subsp. enterica serovar Give str. S5-487]|nr:hypothetical protein LTSEGIV_1329 [Salmonella enterica subsp. enterica serovar Give str. S5-487]